MERHAIDGERAFEMLREHSRIDNRKLIDLATAVVDGHRLLPKEPRTAIVSEVLILVPTDLVDDHEIPGRPSSST